MAWLRSHFSTKWLFTAQGPTTLLDTNKSIITDTNGQAIIA